MALKLFNVSKASERNNSASDYVTSSVCPCQTMVRASNANISSAVDGMCPLGDYSVQHCVHWAEIQDSQRLRAAFPSMHGLFEQIITAVASGPLGTDWPVWEGIDCDSPLSLLISYSCVIADGCVRRLESLSLVCVGACMLMLIAAGGSHTLLGFGKWRAFTSLYYSEKSNL